MTLPLRYFGGANDPTTNMTWWTLDGSGKKVLGKPFTDEQLATFLKYDISVNWGLAPDSIYDFSNTSDIRGQSPTLAELIADELTRISEKGINVYANLDMAMGTGPLLTSVMSPTTLPSEVPTFAYPDGVTSISTGFPTSWEAAVLDQFGSFVKYDPNTMYNGYIGPGGTPVAGFGYYPLQSKGCWNYDAGRYCNASDLGTTINVGRTFSGGMVVTQAHLPTTPEQYNTFYGVAFEALCNSEVIGFNNEEGYDSGNEFEHRYVTKPWMQYLSWCALASPNTDNMYGWYNSRLDNFNDPAKTHLQNVMGWLTWLFTQIDGVMWEMYLPPEIMGFLHCGANLYAFPPELFAAYPSWPEVMATNFPTKHLATTTMYKPPGPDGINGNDGTGWWGTTVCTQQQKNIAQAWGALKHAHGPLKFVEFIESGYDGYGTGPYTLEQNIQFYQAIGLSTPSASAPLVGYGGS